MKKKLITEHSWAQRCEESQFKFQYGLSACVLTVIREYSAMWPATHPLVFSENVFLTRIAGTASICGLMRTKNTKVAACRYAWFNIMLHSTKHIFRHFRLQSFL